MNRYKALLALLLAALIAAAAVFGACASPAPADDGSLSCTLYIDCKTILSNMAELDPEKAELIPADGVILEKVEVRFAEGESVYDILLRELRARGIHIESSFTPVYNSAYVEGINNIYEFDCGPLSGWEYRVNGEFPNYGCSGYYPKDGDEIEFLYTCDLGADIGDSYNAPPAE